MDTYRAVLAVHLLTLVTAACASSLVHYAMGRRQKATTGREAGEWHRMGGVVSKVFPIAIVLFFATGEYMVARSWSWQTGFVQAGAIGALLLLVNGIIIGVRSRALIPMLIEAGDRPLSEAARARMNEPVINTLPWVNHLIALAIVVIMTLKPTLSGSVFTLIIAVAAGLVLANRYDPRRSQAASKEAAASRV